MPRISAAFFFLLVHLGSASAASSGQVRVTEIGPHRLASRIERLAPRRVYAWAQVTIPVSPERVWAVLTDYDHQAQFLPDLKRSQVVRREGNRLVVYQEGEIWFPMYRRMVQVVFRVQEIPKSQVLFEAVEGDFVWNQGYWYLEPAGAGTRITYEATLEPNFWIPEWVFRELERSSLKRNFRAILKRCEAP